MKGKSKRKSHRTLVPGHSAVSLKTSKATRNRYESHRSILKWLTLLLDDRSRMTLGLSLTSSPLTPPARVRALPEMFSRASGAIVIPDEKDK